MGESRSSGCCVWSSSLCLLLLLRCFAGRLEKGRLKEASSLLQRGEASEEGGRILRAVSRESRVGLRGGFCVFPPNFFSSPLFGESWRSAGTRRKERRKRRPISFPGSASSSLLLCPSIATAS